MKFTFGTGGEEVKNDTVGLMTPRYQEKLVVEWSVFFDQMWGYADADLQVVLI